MVTGDVPTDEVFRTDRILAFRDIAPQAPSHVLVIPADHHANIAELANADPALTAELVATATKVAHAEGLPDGFRLVTNTGPDACQSVEHVHLHVLGGRGLNGALG